MKGLSQSPDGTSHGHLLAEPAWFSKNAKHTGSPRLTIPDVRRERDPLARATEWLQRYRHLVFDALTRPDLLKRWYGPRGWSLVVCEIDLRVGGAWRFVTRRADGRDVAQRGIYREIVRPERLVNSESWEDRNPGEVLVTAVLAEQGGKTTLTSSLLFPSQEVRDTLVKSGMTSGAAETYDKLAEYLASVA